MMPQICSTDKIVAIDPKIPLRRRKIMRKDTRGNSRTVCHAQQLLQQRACARNRAITPVRVVPTRHGLPLAARARCAGVGPTCL